MKTNFLLIKKSFVALLILFIALSFSNNVKGGEALGIELSYQCTSTPGVYTVTAKLYRPCAGLAFCIGCNAAIPNGNTSGCTAPLTTSIKGISPGYLGVNYGSFTLYATGGNNGYDIVQTCSSINSICTNCNTRSAGTYATGIEVYSYEATVNLNAIPTACCKVSINIDICCAANIITTHNTSGLFVTADIDRCQTSCNSAPVFTNDAQALVCNGIDFVYNLGAIDIDGDSLSYAFGSAMQTSSGFNSIVPYITPYSSTYPFPFLGSPNMNAAYPGGLRIDPINGDILFRPNANFATRFVIDVTQWRLVSGFRINIGVTRREVVLISQTCSSNKIPILKTYRNGLSQNGNQNFVAYAGQQFCLDVVAQDQAISSTDPTTADTTDLKWNNPGLVNNYMSNATFTRNYILANRVINGPKADSFKFCWTPSISAIRSLPHLFTVSGSDRNCPLRAVFTRGISITVESPKMLINETTKKVFCNNKTTTFNINYSANGVNLLSNNVFTVQLSDSFGSFNNATTIGTVSNTISYGTILATLPSGLALNKTYKLRLLSSSNNTVETVPYDLTITQGYNQPIITSNSDTFCQGPNALISLNSTVGISSYKWLLDSHLIANAFNNNILAELSGTYSLIVSNAGCSDTSNSKNVTVYPKPITNFTAPTSVCLGSSNLDISFINTSTLSTGTMNYNWKFSDNTNSNLLNVTKTVVDTGNFIVKLITTSNNNCVDSISKTINVRKAPKAIFLSVDTVQCLTNNNFEFRNQSEAYGQSNQYTWHFGVGNNVISNNLIRNFSYNFSGVYSVKLMALSSNNCADTFTQIVNVVDKATSVNFTINKAIQCLKGNNFIFTNQSTPNNSSLSYKWYFGTGDSSTQQSPNFHYLSVGGNSVKLVVTANNECIDSVTKNITVNANAVANFSINNASQCLIGNAFGFINSATNSNNQTWDFGDESNSNVLNPSKTYTSAGSFLVKLVANNNSNCADSIYKSLYVLANPTIGNIVGNATPNSISTPFTYSVSNQLNSIYNWTATNGTILSGQGTNTVNVVWPNVGIGSLKAKITSNNSCTDSTNLLLNITSVGLQNLSLENDLKVYPNPTESFITITNKNNLVGKNYIITNLVGQTLLSGKLNLDETIVNLETLQSGMYFLSLDGTSKQSIKVIKE
ncbi:MAG: PKD domain-containing protein [Bacteroidia bacterium]